MPPNTYNLRNREPSNGDDAHVDVSADTQTVDSEPSEINTHYPQPHFVTAGRSCKFIFWQWFAEVTTQILMILVPLRRN